MNYKLASSPQKRLQLAGTTLLVFGLGCTLSPISAAPPSTTTLMNATVASGPKRLPRGSFVKSYVDSLEGFLQHLDKHPEVVERYAKVINMSPRMIKLAFKELHLTTLKEDMTLDVYYYHPKTNGEAEVGHKAQRFKKGTRVFALEDGTPAMIQVCGNPTRAVRTLPELIKKNRIAGETNKQEPPPSGDQNVRIADGTPNIALSPEDLPTGELQPIPSNQLFVPPEPTLPQSQLASLARTNLAEWIQNGARVGGGGSSFGPIVGGVLGAGAIAAAVILVNPPPADPGSGGGGNPPPVPEPNAPFMLLTMAGTGVALYQWRRLRAKTSRK